ncbi:MAG TPA: hypothetical protein VE621_03025, partial [Bryobacteraceae bacterium]|nr:hypothetical protein [Bryobacteraceae bacterium]
MRQRYSRVRQVTAAIAAGLAALLFAVCSRTQQSVRPRLEKIGEIWKLRPADARRGYPVAIRGHVTYFDARLQLLIVQDPTGGISLDTSGVLPPLSVGQEVAISGFTGYEANVPVIVMPVIRPGSTGQDAAPEPIDSGRFWNGGSEYRWVQVTARLLERRALDSDHASFRISV